MTRFFRHIFLILAFAYGECSASGIFPKHCQLLVVTTDSWEDAQGRLQLFERQPEEMKWTLVGESIPVVVGKKGMSWGIGLHSSTDSKIEGDLKSPAGIFSIGHAFGHLPMDLLKIEYLHLNEFIEVVDDPLSRYYNHIVDCRIVPCDWLSSEKMGSEPLYQMGFTVDHNFPNPKAGKGSAIFFSYLAQS